MLMAYKMPHKAATKYTKQLAISTAEPRSNNLILTANWVINR